MAVNLARMLKNLNYFQCQCQCQSSIYIAPKVEGQSEELETKTLVRQTELKLTKIIRKILASTAKRAYNAPRTISIFWPEKANKEQQSVDTFW